MSGPVYLPNLLIGAATIVYLALVIELIKRLEIKHPADWVSLGRPSPNLKALGNWFPLLALLFGFGDMPDDRGIRLRFWIIRGMLVGILVAHAHYTR